MTVFQKYNRRVGWHDVPTITAGGGRALVAAETERATSKGALELPSRVNRILTKQQALDILRKGIAKLGDAEPIQPLIAKNIARECGSKIGVES